MGLLLHSSIFCCYLWILISFTGMGFEDLEPIFGEPKVEWDQGQDSVKLRPFLFHVSASDPSHLRIDVTDFHFNTWEAVKSVVQLEDM
ncbi:hypothetical protein CMV_015495, partial [Castanea mollissima]